MMSPRSLTDVLFIGGQRVIDVIRNALHLLVGKHEIIADRAIENDSSWGCSWSPTP